MTAWIQLYDLGERDKQKLATFASTWFSKRNYSAQRIQEIVDDINNSENGLMMLGTFRKYFPRGTGEVGVNIRNYK